MRRGITPDILTDQTSAHDPLNGYVPSGITLADAVALRASDPKAYVERSIESIGVHVRAMLDLKRRGAVTFDYGNNIRAFAVRAGVEDAFEIPGFVPEFIRPLFCEGKGPFRWAALSGNPDDIRRTDKLALEMFPRNEALTRWIRLAQERIHFQGLPARICWLGYGERAEFGLAINDLVKRGEIECPIVIGRDHLDCGSVASPNRETEGMLDGSDAVADWALLNALVNTAAGASGFPSTTAAASGSATHSTRAWLWWPTAPRLWRGAWSVCSRPIRAWASFATRTPGTTMRSGSPAATASRCRWTTSTP